MTNDIYVDGRWIASASDESIEVINPATEEVIGSVPAGTAEDVVGAAAAANTVIAIKERDGLIQRAKENGEYFVNALKQELEPLPIVGQVRGIGMWHAVDFTSDKATKAPLPDDVVRAIVRRMAQYGVIASPIGTAFEMAPPLIVTREELDTAVEVASRAIREIAKERGYA